jgi:hypothetical protein
MLSSGIYLSVAPVKRIDVSAKQWPINSNSAVPDEHDCGVPLQEAIFAVRHEARPRCELGRLSRYPDDGGDMFIRNVGSSY